MDYRDLNKLIGKLSGILNNFTTSNRAKRLRRLLRALGYAVLAHMVLVLVLPDLPKLTIPSIDRGRAIRVFLRATPEPEVFEQTLQNPGLLANQLRDTRPTAGIIPAQSGSEDENSEAAPTIDSERQDNSQSNASGSEENAGIKPNTFITTSTIRLFAQREAFQHAESNPDALQRFQRSFRSVASYRRRSRSDSYIDRYGDYYVRTSSSTGDICFKQEKELQVDDFSTNTVMFFSCERGPLKIDLDNEIDLEPEKTKPLQVATDAVALPK